VPIGVTGNRLGVLYNLQHQIVDEGTIFGYATGRRCRKVSFNLTDSRRLPLWKMQIMPRA
jgi:hypothetical protein